MFADINVCEFVILKVFALKFAILSLPKVNFPTYSVLLLLLLIVYIVYIKYGDPDQTGIAKILPCLSEHN